MAFNIVLIEPEIPQNTGNISRTCAATDAKLHLVGPMGFSIDDRWLKRAGLDYWDKLQVAYYDNITQFFDAHPQADFYYCTTKADKLYADVVYPDECFFVFGKETKGLPEDLLRRNRQKLIRIPMGPEIRSLNLSNAVAICLYEALRQKGFSGLEKAGILP